MMFIIIYGQILFQSDCGYPKLPVLLLLAQDIFIFSLFLDFYIKNYVTNKPKIDNKIPEQIPISSCSKNGNIQNGNQIQNGDSTQHEKTKDE